jgi:glycine dehydrogenase
LCPWKTNENGAIMIEDLREKAQKHAEDLGWAAMITYPFNLRACFRDDKTSVRLISVVHEFGGLVYLDGANMNAQVGLCRTRRFTGRNVPAT